MSETLTIDGQIVEFEAGMTILQVATAAGIDIPHICYHPHLPHQQASCRLCVVEVQGARTLVAACAHPASKDLVIHTKSERVQQARRASLELLLSDHPTDCMTCEQAGSCLLEEYAYKLGVRTPDWPGEKHNLEIDNSNPFFSRDYNKCIACGNCIEACNEVECDDAITAAYKGFDARPSAPFDGPLQESSCTFCGNCIQVCPTGALVEHARMGKGREWEFAKTRTICPYCGCGCGLILQTKAGKVIRSGGDAESPVNHGWLCVKGRFGMDFINSPDRVLTPLVAKKRGDPRSFKETSWSAALDLVAARLKEIKEKHGPDALAFLASAKCTNEENYLMQKLARGVIGTNNVDHCARLCHASTVAGLAAAFGSGAMTGSEADLEKSDCIFIIGSNTTESHPIVALPIKHAVRRHGAKLILADPRKIPISRFSGLWMRQLPGTDVALLNAMANVILAEGLEDKEFINNRTEGFEEFAAGVKELTPEWAQKITNIPADDIRQAARTFASAQRGAIVFAMGMTQHTCGTENVFMAANLAMLCGHIGKEGAGVFPLRGQNNVQGACDLGALPGDFPGYQKVAAPEVRAKFSRAWGREVPEKPGLTVVEIMEAAEEGKIKGLVIMGENPAISDPNLNHVRRALQKVEFLCVIDMFVSDTGEFADVILPACSFAEKEGTFTNTERRLQRLTAALEPKGESLPDWRILCALSERLGFAMNYDSPEAIFDEIASLTPILGGMSYTRMGHVGLQWPCPTLDHPGTPVLHTERFTRGLGKFHVVPFRPPAEVPDKEYPFIFTTGRMLYQYHTGTMSRRSKSIEAHAGRPYVEINPQDAAKLGLKDGAMVRLKSRRGEIEAAAKVSDTTAPGVIFMTFHYREAAANLLTNDALDPYAKIPEFKACAVHAEAVK